MSAQTIVVDPVTRIEGHLRIEAETDGNVITRASSSGTMVRGIEIILRGRDPRDAWAFAQRICGVCTLVHGIASVRAVEDALKYDIPRNANLIRNLMIGAQFVHDHDRSLCRVPGKLLGGGVRGRRARCWTELAI